MAAKAVISVSLGGREYRLRSDTDEKWLQSVAAYVDESMGKIRSRTETVDSLDVAMLTALNIARELIELREHGPRRSARVTVDPERMASLIKRVESALNHDEAASSRS